MAKTRINITLSDELKEWYSEKAGNYGMSVSSLMVMALAQYKEQQETIKAMGNMELVNNRLNEFELKNKSK